MEILLKTSGRIIVLGLDENNNKNRFIEVEYIRLLRLVFKCLIYFKM